jgi:K+-sensing histidine kinase KdpD
MARSNGVTVRFTPAPDAPYIRADDDRLRQVLINVVSNAIKYNTATTPQIPINANVAGGAVRIDIVDNGGGVRRQDAAEIFEKFARAGRANREQGAGLGLPIIKAIMRAMDGDLTVEFAPDGTSFFRLTLTMNEPTTAS